MLTLVPTSPPKTTKARVTRSTLNQKPEPMLACLPGFDIPQFVARLSAGFPSPATDYMEEGLDLNTFLVVTRQQLLLLQSKAIPCAMRAWLMVD